MQYMDMTQLHEMDLQHFCDRLKETGCPANRMMTPDPNKLAIEKARDLEEIRRYLKKLRDGVSFNGFSYAVRRYLFRRYGKEDCTAPAAYTVTIRDERQKKRSYSFGPVLAGQMPPPKEITAYADLLFRLTRKQRCYALTPEGTPNPKKPAISKADYEHYLRGEKFPGRRRLFVVSIALGFDVAAMEDFLTALGEPSYHWKDLDEILFYYLHAHTQGQCTMDDFYRLKNAFVRHAAVYSSGTAPLSSLPGETRVIRREINTMLYCPYPSEQAREDALIRFLSHHVLDGASLTTQALFEDEVRSRLLKCFDYGVVPDHAVIDEEYDILSLSALGDRIYRCTVEGADDSSPGTPVSLRQLSMDPRVKKDLVDGARLRQLLSHQRDNARVTKKDVLHVRFYKLTQSISLSQLSGDERLEVLKEFHASTDRFLRQAKLDVIYPAAPFDCLVLLSLCQPDPLRFFSGVFQEAHNQELSDTV